MRLIGSIPNQQQADRFGDYLITLDIDHSLEQNDGDRWDVWIADDDEVDRGKQELEQFLRSPDDPRYNGAARQASSIRSEKEKRAKKLRQNFIDVRTRWAFGTGRYPLTIALIVICCIVAMATLLGERLDPVGYWLMFNDVAEFQAVLSEASRNADVTETQIQKIVDSFGWGSIRHGQVWRVVTPIFLHFGVIHLIFNLFWLRDLGAMIEMRRSSLLLAGLVLAIAVISNVAEYLWSGPFFGGMSGVVYGLFGYVWMKGRFQPHLNMHVGQQTVMIMLAWLVICGIGIIDDIANAAHVAGLVVGVAFGYLPYKWKMLRRKWQ